jgi:hypothetical protein
MRRAKSKHWMPRGSSGATEGAMQHPAQARLLQRGPLSYAGAAMHTCRCGAWAHQWFSGLLVAALPRCVRINSILVAEDAGL